jgi:C1A family cysteine protease
MKAVVILALLGIAAALVIDSTNVDDYNTFEQWMVKYEKVYSSEEEIGAAFVNVQAAMERAAQRQLEDPTATYGLTKFSDLSPEQFAAQYLGYKPQDDTTAIKAQIPVQTPPTANPPTSWDWRTKNAVTPVKNQAQCGSCWAFSTTESIESFWFLAGNNMTSLSPQQIVSCDKTDGGCNGGDTVTAYAYVKKAGGLEPSIDYPYTSGSGSNGICKVNSKDFVAKITGFTYGIPPCTQPLCDSQNEKALPGLLSTTGPYSICLDAQPWQDYQGGVMKTGCPHGLSSMDHCVQLVGYNMNAPTPYWIVRNSWAANWGEAGYIYLAYGSNLCGVANEVTAATA